MKGHVIISHGLQSGPDATKATALARAAESLGWSCELPDYRDVDAGGVLGDVPARIARLRALAERAPRPLVLAGSSMGAFISGHVSCEVPVLGLFLMAPPASLDIAPKHLRAAVVPTTLVHGWDDELIPAMDVVRWAQRRGDRLVMVKDGHRLERHVAFCAEEFAHMLQRLVP